MINKNVFRELKTFGILWSTQSLSQLGSEMTSFALTLWLYAKTGSALQPVGSPAVPCMRIHGVSNLPPLEVVHSLLTMVCKSGRKYYE
jgi:hypothetical protein